MYVHTFRRSFLVKISLKIKRVSYRSIAFCFLLPSFLPPSSSLSLYALYTLCDTSFSLSASPTPPFPSPRALTSFSFVSLPLQTVQRTCALCTRPRAVSSLPNGNSLLWEPEVVRVYRGDDKSQGRAIDPPPFAILSLSISLSLFPFLVRFTPSLSLSFSQKVPRFFSLFPRPFLDPFLQEHSQSS